MSETQEVYKIQGFAVRASIRIRDPEGQLTKARRFNAGKTPYQMEVPEGTTEARDAINMSP